MRQTILVVDDERDILDLLKYNLEKEGLKVLTASNGKKAWILAQTHPDLIVLDIMMPEMDGLEVCRTRRASFPVHTLSSYPVILNAWRIMQRT
ncbi:MAG: response regulator [Ignavibacteriales bacterium]|nr:response regulator [Ignavibacteriales bacterium]